MATISRRVSSALLAFLAAAGLIASIALHWRLRGMQFDDAYIHLRIARNLLDTGHAFFNPGEAVMATSSPLWTLLLSLLQVPRHTNILPVLEGTLLWGVGLLAAAVAWNTALTLSRPVRIFLSAVAGVLAVAVTMTSSVGFMETPLAMVLLLGACLAFLRNVPVALPLLALAACTRLELLPLLLCTFAVQVYRRRDRIGSLVAVVIVLAAALWTHRQFGVLLPNSMRAKQITYGYTVAQSFREFIQARMRDELLWLLFGVFCAVVAVQLARRWNVTWMRRQWLPAVALVLALEVIAAYILRRTVLFPWYRPLFDVPLFMGVLLYATHRRRRLPTMLLQTVLLVFFCWTYVRTSGAYIAAAFHPTPWTVSRADAGDSTRVMEYLQVADVLRQLCPTGRLMATEIGALGWGFKGHLDDAVGIASPDALQFQPLRSGARLSGIPSAYVAEKRSDMVIDYAMLDTEMIQGNGLNHSYDLVRLPPSPRNYRGGLLDRGWRGSTSLDVWLRRDGACSSDAIRQALRARIE